MTADTPTRVDQIEGLTVGAHCRSSGPGEAGGDWYDVLDLGDDGVAVVVGDVAGHGASAATTMRQLRDAARAYLLDDRDPASVLARMNRFTHWLLAGEVATAVIAIFLDGGSQVQLTIAGHPPPLLLHAAGSEFLDLPRAPALGVSTAPGYTTTTRPLAPGAMLVLYTDGLVERRGEPIDAGLERLRAAAAAHGPVGDLCGRLVATIPNPDDDDLAVVTVRWSGDG